MQNEERRVWLITFPPHPISISFSAGPSHEGSLAHKRSVI